MARIEALKKLTEEATKDIALIEDDDVGKADLKKKVALSSAGGSVVSSEAPVKALESAQVI